MTILRTLPAMMAKSAQEHTSPVSPHLPADLPEGPSARADAPLLNVSDFRLEFTTA